ncbi:MAG: acyl-CoA dehydrogenase family protein [Bacteroidales bacterium]|jgi:alkylation response protein AidB-like acyl-CoA dehydrogenase|nr:acyl-CoA dehydrogenase family protein [Bacteroidales bacterium]
MSDNRQKSMDLAEESREKEWKHPSFVAELFKGNFKWRLVKDFPEQSAEDKKIGDDFIEELKICLEKNIDPEKVDKDGKIPDEAIKELVKLGCFGLKIPKEYGGKGFSNMNYTRIISYVSSYCNSTAVLLSAHQSIGVPQPLKYFGTEQQKETFYPKIVNGALSAFALTEPDVGSDPAKMTTTAKLTDDGEHYIISGEKLWCTNGPDADILLVMAVTQPKIIAGKERQQISAFIVESDAPGFSVLHRCKFMGLGGISNGLLKFDNIKVPKENLVGKEGDGLKIAFTTLNAGRLAIPVCSAASGKLCLSHSRVWANERVQWGNPVGYHQSVSKKIAEMAANTFGVESMSRLSVFMADIEKTDIRLEAAMAKYFGSEKACSIVDEAMQIRGGRGYEKSESLRNRGEEDYPIERYYRDIRINKIIEGTSEIMQLFIAREAVDMHFKMVTPFLTKSSTSTKIKAAFKLLGFYSWWLPKQYIPRLRSFNTKKLNGANKRHLRYISRTSRRLARRLFLSMARFGPKLQDEQLILGNYVDVGVNLFVMSSVLSYTDLLLKNNGVDKGATQNLSDFYCKLARKEIKDKFRNVGSDKGYKKLMKRVNKSTLKGDYIWLENENVYR